MRVLAPTIALLLALAGCRSTYVARADDLSQVAARRGPEATVPALDDDGKPVALEVDSIVWTGPTHADGRQVVRAADGRAARNAGWAILGTGLAVGLVFVGAGSMGSDVSTMGAVLGAMVATPFVLTSVPFLTYGYAVGSPER